MLLDVSVVEVFDVGALPYFDALVGGDVFGVTYDANGAESGTVPTDEGEYGVGDSFVVALNVGDLAVAGLVFKGWNTAADGSGTALYGGMLGTMGSAAMTLYAQFGAASEPSKGGLALSWAFGMTL